MNTSVIISVYNVECFYRTLYKVHHESKLYGKGGV